MRNVRRDGMEQLKRHGEGRRRSHRIEHHKLAHEVQELTDREIKQINDMLTAKETEIMTI